MDGQPQWTKSSWNSFGVFRMLLEVEKAAFCKSVIQQRIADGLADPCPTRSRNLALEAKTWMGLSNSPEGSSGATDLQDALAASGFLSPSNFSQLQPRGSNNDAGTS